MHSSRRDGYRFESRRFKVTVDRLAIYSGVYVRDEVITDFQAGSARDRLLEMGMLSETGYDLKSLGGPADGRPSLH